MPELERFREETRAWLESNCPESMRGPIPTGEVVWGGRKAEFSHPDAKLWLERMGARGWTAPTWPKEYGGGGLTKEQNGVLQEELRRIKARPALFSFGIAMLGPALLEFGSEAQKKEHIPKIVRRAEKGLLPFSTPNCSC